MKLYPSGSTEIQRMIITTLYENPFSTRDEISKLAYASSGYVSETFSLFFDDDDFTRERLFTKLGYITLPVRRSRVPLLNEKLQILLDVWKDCPYISTSSSAEKLNVSRRTLNRWKVELYAFCGYDYKNTPLHLRRLEFYYWMNWFDLPRMQLEARIANRKFGGL